MNEGVERRKDYLEIDHKLELVWQSINSIRDVNTELSLQIAKYMTRQDTMCQGHGAILAKLTENVDKVNKILNGNGVPGLVAKQANVEAELQEIKDTHKERKGQLIGLMISVAVLMIGAIGNGALWIATHIKNT